MKLFERDELLATLQAQLRQASAGPGALVLVAGEAGIGKTAVLQALAASQDGVVPVRWGGCDALQTPRPLGPLFDIAAQAGGELQAALEGEADRLRVFGAFLKLLSAQPSLVLLEDLHWGDDATLDLLRYVGRRIGRSCSLLVGSYRSDEIGPAHPLRMVLGDLATSGIQHLAPQPLSLDAVRELAGDQEIDAAELHDRTGGNPFFVTEVLASDELGVPATVRDAVLTRAARLRPSARAILDAAAVAGPRIEPWLLQDLVAAESAAIEECLATGVLRVQDGAFTFRHELARQAILQALTPTRLLSLHRLVLHALQSPATPEVDLARLAHHAEGAAAAEAVLQFAPAAAREAAARGAHRQAAQQFARALRHAPADPASHASLLEEYAAECHLSGLLDETIDARQAAAGLWRDAGDTDRQAMSLARMAHALVGAGRNAEGEAVLRRALTLAGPEAESAAAVAARRWAAHVRMLDRDTDDAIREGGVAMAIASRLGDRESVVHCLSTIGAAMIVAGRVEEGRQSLEQSRAMAEELPSDAWVANAFGNLGSACGEAYAFDLAEDYLRRGIEFCTDRDIEYQRLYQLSWRALVELYRGRWTEAAATAHAVLAERGVPAIARMMALIALGRLRTRRGDPGVWEVLDEARVLAGHTGTLQRTAPMQAARAEAAWLEGRADDATAEAAPGVELAVRKQHAWFASELLFWCWRGTGSLPVPVPAFCAHRPFALQAEGRWQEAAAGWRALGCPFETASALADGHEAALREALAMFESLGARPMIERVRHKLRAAGVRGLPHGPREATRRHVAGLTSREVAVLALLAEGLRNRDIAQRLNRSVRTVDHHLAALFAKLEVSNRAEAVSAAYRLGVIPTGGGAKDS
jgi:DNA-binding CsgD family transcriptional regulator/tetratricopeptide (TPR) repeat protein